MSIYYERENMSKNDTAWGHFIREKKVLEQLYSPGYLYISADELKDITHREPRLLAKQDSLAQRPRDFRENQIAIFPVKNGQYILFRDTKCRSFYRFSEKELSLPVKTYYSKVDLNMFDAYPGSNCLSESQAIDFAYLSSLLRTFTGEQHLDLVIRGRLFSGSFDFIIPDLNHEVHVNGVQIEVDAGYESNKGIYLIEAKKGKRDDFHIRQLYYPYLEWTHKSKKEIHTIFLVNTNSKYYIYEFLFSEKFGDLVLSKSICVMVNESPIVELSISKIIRNPKIIKENQIPFPQANDLDKVIDLISLLSSDRMNKYRISDFFEFEDRQGDYYANAAMYLGFVSKENTDYFLTPLGYRLVELKSQQERTSVIIDQIFQHNIFVRSFELLVKKGLDFSKLSDAEIGQVIQENTNLSGSTPLRRASTVRKWLEWVTQNSKIC